MEAVPAGVRPARAPVRPDGDAGVALFTPGIWKGYFSEGELRVKAEASASELHLVGVPLPHIYAEILYRFYVTT